MPSLRDLLFGQSKPAGNTLALQQQYRDYVIQTQGAGQQALPWEQFIQQYGYRPDRNGNAVKVNQQR